MYLGLFLICLLGCYFYLIFIFSNSYLVIVVSALILAALLKTFILQGDKIKELESRIQAIESDQTKKDQISSQEEL